MSPAAGYVLDTNVVSALRIPGRNPAVERWAASVPVNHQFIAAPSVAEIERGVLARERTDPRQGAALRRWFEVQVLPAFGGRVLPLDLAAARVLAAFRVPEHAPLDDALIAAIAHSAGLVVATRNTRHFLSLGVPVMDPWDAAT